MADQDEQQQQDPLAGYTPKQAGVPATDPLAEYDQKAAAPQTQDQPLPAGYTLEEAPTHVLPRGHALASESETVQHNAKLPSGYSLDLDGTGRLPNQEQEGILKPGVSLKPQELNDPRFAAMTPKQQQEILDRHARSRYGKDINEGRILEPSTTRDKVADFFEDIGEGVGKSGAEGLRTGGKVAASALRWVGAHDIADKITNERGSGIVDALDTERHGLGEAIGATTENIIEFLAGDEALKVLGGAFKLAKGSKLAEAVAEWALKNPLKAKSLEVVIGGMRQGAVAGGQTLLHGGTAEDAGMQALKMAGLGSLFETLGAMGAANSAGLRLAGKTGAIVTGSLLAGEGIREALTPRQEGETRQQAIDRQVGGAANIVMSMAAVGDGSRGLGEAVSDSSEMLRKLLGEAQTVPEAYQRAARFSAKRGTDMVDRFKSAEKDLIEITNNNPGMETPGDVADAINTHMKSRESVLLEKAEATEGSPDSVVANFRQRLNDRLDAFFKKQGGFYTPDERVALKEEINGYMDQEHDLGNGVTAGRDPNLFEAEGIRQRLNEIGDVGALDDKEVNARKAAFREAAALMREVIDESFENKGVRNVKEWRSKEADLIEIRKAMRDMQSWMDKNGPVVPLRELLKGVGRWKMMGIIASYAMHLKMKALGLVLGGVAADSALAKSIEYKRNPMVNIGRAQELSAQQPDVTGVAPQPGGPELQGPQPAPPGYKPPTPPPAPETPPTAPAGAPEGFPPPPQPPTPAVAPTDHRLHAALASAHLLGSPGLGSAEEKSVGELLQKFSNLKADMRQDIANKGGKYTQDQIDEAMKLQAKIDASIAVGREYVEKKNAANQEKYEKEKAKYDAKLKAETAKQDAQRKTEAAQKEEQMRASLLADERVAHSPVMKATEKPLEITGVDGHTSEQAHGHEAGGHMMAAVAEGLEPSAFLTDQHPDAMEDGAAAQVHIDTSMAEKGPKGIAQKVVAILGGPAFDEVHSGIPMSKNTGARDDIRRARQLLGPAPKDAPNATEYGGLRGAALDKVFDALYERAKGHVSNPEALAIVQSNIRVREAGLHPHHHMSPGRLAEYVKKLQGVYGSGKTPSTEVLREGATGERDSEGKSDDAGAAGEKQVGAAKGVRAEALRESDEGGGEPGRGKSGRLEKAALAKDSISERLVDTFGTTEDPHAAGFILSDGRMVPLKGEHNSMLNTLYDKYGDIGINDAERTAFINQEKAVRTRYRTGKGGAEVVFSVPKTGVSPEQIEQIQGSVGKLRNGNVVMEISESGGKSAKKEFARVSDVKPMLQEIGALPATQKMSLSKGAKMPGELKDIGDEFNKSEGRKEIKHNRMEVDPRQSEMADAYNALKHEPNNPEVKKAYDSFKGDIDKQFDLLAKHGIKVDAYDHDPYEGENLGVEGEQSGAERAYQALRKDVTENHHVSVWKGGAPPADHPLSEVDPKTGLTYNEKLRAIHDVFGHVVPDNGFDAAGEESAWDTHRQMFSDDSNKVLPTETRGQTAYVTKYGQFADQRAGILPEEFRQRPEDIGGEESKKDKSMPLWWNEQVDPTVYKGDTKGGKLVKDAAEQGGFSIHPRTGEVPKDGFMVEAFPEKRVSLDRKPTNEDIRDFMVENRPLFNKNEKLYAGGYANGPQGYELNVAGRYGNEQAAIDAAKKLGQISIWDVKNQKEIPTGGTGEKTEFSEYPEEQRLADLSGSHTMKASLAKTPKGSTTPLMEQPLGVKGTGEGGKISTLDVAKELNKFSKKSNPALEIGKAEPEEMVKRAREIAEDEAKYQLASGRTGTEWYTTEMKDHDAALQRMRPELATGPQIDTPTMWPHTAKQSLFKAAEAVLSSGQKPYGNFKSAVKAWDAFNETGEFPRMNPENGKSWGPRGEAAYGNALDMINRLVKEKGEKGAADWLLSEHPISELRGFNKDVKGKMADLRPGAIILGEKRGPFMQNLHGIESAFTADMWVSRSWNRWMGTMEFQKNPKSGLMEISTDSPRNQTERALMKESFSKTAEKLSLSTSSLQAVLWYYEQALYRAHGVPKESWSFSDAAKRVEKEQPPKEEAESFPFGGSAKGKGVEAGLSGLVGPQQFANISGKNQ